MPTAEADPKPDVKHKFEAEAASTGVQQPSGIDVTATSGGGCGSGHVELAELGMLLAVLADLEPELVAMIHAAVQVESFTDVICPAKYEAMRSRLGSRLAVTMSCGKLASQYGSG
jgi:hypothetical protein